MFNEGKQTVYIYVAITDRVAVACRLILGSWATPTGYTNKGLAGFRLQK